MTESKPSRPSPPRYNHDDIDRQLLGLIRQRDCTYRDLARSTGYGMYVLTHSVARLREAGLVIPGVRSRKGFLVAVRRPNG
jgi:DNA-binding transcriptional ArsR family regulator